MDGRKVENWLAEVVKATTSGHRVVHVGCDSQQHNLYTEFVTVVPLLVPGKGGRVLWTSERVPRIRQLRERLLREVQLAIETAFMINAVISEDIELNVHVDANPDLSFKSSDYVKELVGYVTGCGFNALTKPDSWAAMHVADHVVKHKHERRG